MAATYRTPARGARGELKEKGSRFLAYVEPAAGAEEARSFIDGLAVRHRDATHVCWAYRLSSPPSEGRSDAGEPAGTAGMPMLQVLRGADLRDVVAVVVRWFGGTKLGKGGLARAYAGAVKCALCAVEMIERSRARRFEIEVSYDQLGAIRRRIQPPEVTLVGADYGERGVKIELEIHEDRCDDFGELLAALGCDMKVLK